MYPDVIESLDNYKTAKREYFEAARKLYALVSAKYDPNNKIGIDYKVTMVRALGVLSSNGFNANGIRMFSNANERNSFGVSDDCYKRMTEIVDPNGPLKMLDNKEIRIQAFDFESKNTRVFEAGVNARALMDKYFGPRLRQGRFS